MPEDLFDEPERRAAERLAAARRLLAQGKVREALDALNLAIALAPGNPESFVARADVFERMGLGPQAEADRRRAGELAALAPPPPSPPPPGPPPPAPAPAPPGEAASPEATRAPPRARPRAPREPPPPVEEEAYHYPIPQDIPRERTPGVGQGTRLAAMVGAIVAVGAIAGGALFLALSSGDGDGAAPDGTPFGPTGVAVGDGSPTESPEPTIAGSPSTSGDPYTLSVLLDAWEGKGLAVKAGAASEGFTGFQTVPVDISLSRGGSTSTTSVFVYKSRDAALAEWDLVPGSRPAPKGGRELPAHVSAWWNANLVVILRTDAGGLGPDALDGLINLGG